MDVNFFERFNEIAKKYRVLVTKQPPMEFSEGFTTMEEIGLLNHEVNQLKDFIASLIALVSELLGETQGAVKELPKYNPLIRVNEQSGTGYELALYGQNLSNYEGVYFGGGDFGYRLLPEDNKLHLQVWVRPVSQILAGAWVTVSTVEVNGSNVFGVAEPVNE